MTMAQQYDYQRRDSAEELLAGWMGELESVLYSPEVEEAIKEVELCVCVLSSNYLLLACLGLPE